MRRSANTDPVQKWMKSMKKKLRKKAFKMKAKFILSVILPGVIVFLGTATARIFLRMSLRKAAASVKTAKEKPDKPARWAATPPAEHPVQDAPDAQAAGPDEAVRPEPAVLTREKPEFVTPEAVGTETVR